METTLRRTVPFLFPDKAGTPQVFRLDLAALAPGRTPGSEFLTQIATSLDLGYLGESLPEEIVVELVNEQYEVCLEYIFSHPIWAAFRKGEGHKSLLAYVLETRHYLEAAASRMAPGVASNWHDGPLTDLLAEHLVEEADHARYFEESLSMLGCASDVVSRCRPSPSTVEWIFVMRALADQHPLVAAICSGLMEMSAADSDVVLDWHEMLIAKDMLPSDSVNAFMQHVHEDIELGHGSNWREALRIESPVTPFLLRDCLNSVCIVAEMLVRWMNGLQDSLSGDLVRVMSGLSVSPQAASEIFLDPFFNGLPVWPAEILHQVSYGAGQAEGACQVLAVAYHLEGDVVGQDAPYAEITQKAKELTGTLASSHPIPKTPEALIDILRSWLRSLDGHRLWSQMVENPTVSLVYGWLLENYFYLCSSSRHVSAAIAACTDPRIRKELVEHLEEEADHGEILKKGLETVPGVVPLHCCRPLPTTVAFIGYFCDLANTDWRAYCVALGYLQYSLEPGDKRHSDFYRTVSTRCPEATPLLEAMRTHDTIDAELGHEDSISHLLHLLHTRHTLDNSTLGRAALVAQLSWSFLDGIRAHYEQGPSAVAQRIGWSISGHTE